MTCDIKNFDLLEDRLSYGKQKVQRDLLGFSFTTFIFRLCLYPRGVFGFNSLKLLRVCCISVGVAHTS